MDTMGIKVIIEKNIPFIRGLLDGMADVSYLPVDEITPEAMRDADALVTRTRTRCDARLLDGSRCSFIATATIGTDHIDLEYCRNRGITVANAPGCNAPAVAQYVFASIAAWRNARQDSRPLESLAIGIVGVGHVGSIVERWARQLGMKVFPCDPPRAEAEPDGVFASLDEVARNCDIITFHTPLTRSGKYPTYHVCDTAFLAKTARRPLIIDSARGPITDTGALVSALDSGIVADAVIDCWEGEPAVSPELLQRAVIATPHIAGYSREGKIRATSMAVKALCRHFGLPETDVAEPVPAGAADSVTLEAVIASYDPMEDTLNLKTSPEAFESLRNNYRLRNEVKSAH